VIHSDHGLKTYRFRDKRPFRTNIAKKTFPHQGIYDMIPAFDRQTYGRTEIVKQYNIAPCMPCIACMLMIIYTLMLPSSLL